MEMCYLLTQATQEKKYIFSSVEQFLAEPVVLGPW